MEFADRKGVLTDGSGQREFPSASSCMKAPSGTRDPPHPGYCRRAGSPVI
jgi:hypothetical protein